LKESGLVLGLGFLLFGAILAVSTLSLLHAASQNYLEKNPGTDKRDYEDLGEYCFGKIFSQFVKIVIILLNFGS
jgi:hypothetical protein